MLREPVTEGCNPFVFCGAKTVAYSQQARLLRFARNDKFRVSLRGAERRSNLHGRIRHRAHATEHTLWVAGTMGPGLLQERTGRVPCRAAAERIMDRAQGPTVLAGHSNARKPTAPEHARP